MWGRVLVARGGRLWRRVGSGRGLPANLVFRKEDSHFDYLWAEREGQTEAEFRSETGDKNDRVAPAWHERVQVDTLISIY